MTIHPLQFIGIDWTSHA